MTPQAIEPAAGLDALARFAAQADSRTLPPDIVRRAQACLLYGLAVGIASARGQAPRLAAAALDWEHPDAGGRATRLLDGRRLPVGAAAFCNGVLLHTRVQEDAHPAGHLGVAVLPAALAVAEQAGSRGADLLGAIAAGYETALRIGRDHAADASAQGFRTTSIYGVFGAAAATARLMGLDAERTRNALAIAASAAGGLREFVNAGTEEYPLHAGLAARGGISAAACAQAGIAAAASSLEGDAGFFRGYAGSGGPHAERLAHALGEEFEFRAITYKPYPTCQFHRSVVRGVLALRGPLDAPLRKMALHMHPFEADFVGVRHAGPFRQFSQTFMSAPFCAALAWIRGRVGYDDMHRYDDAEVLACIPRIEVVSDPAVARYKPKIVVSCEDGTVREWTERQGGDAFLLTWDAAAAMADTLCGEARIAPALARELADAADELPDAPSVSRLMTAAARAAAQAGQE
jgi:2-methylcitrate dehydratase PrpD